MAKGAISATDTVAELVPADPYRGEVVLQHISGDAIFLEFGELCEARSEGLPVVDEGLVLSNDFHIIIINDERAPMAINGICDTGESATGTYCTF